MEISASAEAMLGILGLGGGEWVLLMVIFVLLFGANRIPPFARGLGLGITEFLRAGRAVRAEFVRESRRSGQEIGESLGAGLGKPVADALTHSNQTCEFQDPPALRLRQIKKQMRNQFILWVAQGFGAGRIPVAPGTFGSLVGLVWFVVLLLPGNFWVYLGGMLAGMFLSVRLCGAAEKILNQPDPGSVVLDEIIAVPICFGAWVGALLFKNGAMPPPEYFFSRDTWLLTFGVCAAFRLFDIAKPWPVRQSQKLPGGWGVTLDDVLAALYVNAVVALALLVSAGR